MPPGHPTQTQARIQTQTQTLLVSRTQAQTHPGQGNEIGSVVHYVVNGAGPHLLQVPGTRILQMMTAAGAEVEVGSDHECVNSSFSGLLATNTSRSYYVYRVCKRCSNDFTSILSRAPLCS